MKAAWYILIILFTTPQGCKKDCDETYTISGQIINGTTMEPYADTNISGYVREDKNFGGSNSAQLFRSKTDSEGKFTVTYNCTDIDGDIQFLLGNWETYLPKNQNITDKIIYFSDSATVNLTFKTSTPLTTKNDTLFWAYAPLGRGIFKDTIVGPKPYQHSITFKVPVTEIDFIYTKSGKEFNELLVGNAQITQRMIGAPLINEVTIEY